MSTASLSKHPAFTALRLGDFVRNESYRVVRRAGSRNWLLFATAEGRGRIIHPEGRVACQPGSLVTIAPGLPHDYATDSGQDQWVFAWAHFKPLSEWMPLLQWPEGLPGIRMLAPRSPSAFARILTLLRDGARRQAESHSYALEWTHLRLYEALLECAQLNPLAEAKPTDPRIRLVCDHLARQLPKRHSLATMAAMVSLSTIRFAHLFRTEMGVSPMVYLERMRMQIAAKRLTQSGCRIETVAKLVGYSNAGHFSTRFRRWSGTTPCQWREHKRANA